MACTGREQECVTSKELRCWLVRNTVTSMLSILRASQQGEEVRYPPKHEVTAKAKRIVEYYPMLQDKDKTMKHLSIYNTLHKRLQNVKSPQKRQGPTPERGQPKKRIDFSSSDNGEDNDADSSGGSTVILHETSGSSSDDGHTALEYAIALFRALPTLFPSPTAPPKKMGHASEALLHPTEDPTIYLQKRSISSPVLIFDGSNCLLAIETTPITTFAKEDLSEALLYLMAYYYTLHLTYPRCVATLLSVIQTEILQDTLHEQDATASFKKAMAEWKDFIGQER
ncbi:unnamed protein product [Leuciscus chuanchicus]